VTITFGQPLTRLSLSTRCRPETWSCTTPGASALLRFISGSVQPALVGTFLRGGGRFTKVNDVALRRSDTLDPDGIIDLLARNLRPEDFLRA
jgi:hypothetical protein